MGTEEALQPRCSMAVADPAAAAAAAAAAAVGAVGASGAGGCCAAYLRCLVSGSSPPTPRPRPTGA